MKNKKKILIIGKNSFFYKNFKSYLKEYKLLEIGRKDKIEKVNFKNIDFIINCAADVYNEKNMFENNTHLVFKILKKYINEKSKAKIIHFGTSGEYGRLNKPAIESFAPNPETIYEGTKSAATMLVQSFTRQFNIPSIIIRPYSIYGPYENSSRIIPNIFRHFLIGDSLKIYDGYHDYYYIDDLSRLIISLIKKWKIKHCGEILNVGSGKQYSNFEVLKFCEKAVKKKAFLKRIYRFNKKYDNKIWYTKINKLKKYKYQSKTSLEKGIKIYWNNVINNKDLFKHIIKYNNQPHKEWK